MRNVTSVWYAAVIWCVVFISMSVFPLNVSAIDVRMLLNDAGFISFDHFKAELYLNNHDSVVPDALIYGVLEVYGSFYYWPDFGTEVNYRMDMINVGETVVPFLEFDFPDIDDVIPFGPMTFWGAWYVDIDHYGYDAAEFWLDEVHKWTPTPTMTPLPTDTPVPPTETYTTTPTLTPISVDGIVGNMRYVPGTGAGGFIQGSPNDEPCRSMNEGPQFIHILTRNVAVMETEVSRQMWADLRSVQATLPADPSNTAYSPTLAHPVQHITWFESILFCNLLSLHNGVKRCYYTDAGFTDPITASNYTTGPFYCNFDATGYRLPTEGEWEYFCRAGTTEPFSCNEMNYTYWNCGSCTAGTHLTLEQYCVFCANDPGTSAIAGSKLPNPWNLKDVHGNVWEWCWDRWSGAYPSSAQKDYAGPATGSSRVRRGGSWGNRAKRCRSASRLNDRPRIRDVHLGLRVVRVAP